MECYIDNFITYLREVKHASLNTVKAYQNDLKKMKLYMEKQNITTVTKISETSLTSYVLSLEKDGLSPASVSRNIVSIKGLLIFLQKSGRISENPSERMKPPTVVRKAPKILDTEQMDKLLQQPDIKTKKGIRDKAMLELLYATGIKVSEMVSLKLSDINLKMRYITCEGKRERNIPFGEPAKEALQGYLNLRQQIFDKCNSDIFFLNSSGEQLSRQGLWKILKTYAATAGIADINPNLIRHSFAVHLVENGADLESVRELLGHNDISATQQFLPILRRNSREVYRRTHPRA
jgi:integrase/recombinase XerD